ncbi:hypothetical protein KHP11_05590 [Rhodococcus erythropolis]|uniref:hypothetical protein n=1 Tax=Rhodococcus erythropolis TaxID=1833 RepID=UPI0008A60645|nr:hypothetical protein [Rhodococcus erythropolis]MBT1253909.1 hypothetical protein [Rhodococcus erythropolis]OHF29124.1 hypothetical protein BKP30_03115 [Rhodococcus erythropolis]
MLYPKSPFVLGRTKLALLVIFALLGACQASWVTVTPDVKNALELTTSGFGFVILGLPGGSLCGLLATGRLIAARGARRAISIG